MKARIAIFIFLSGLLLFQLPARAETAKAFLRGTQEGSPLEGAVLFEETDNGLSITAEVRGAPPGEHGFHVHALGSCANDGAAAGGHYNPEDVNHGFLPEDGLDNAHAGDLGNIKIDDNGNGRFQMLIFEDLGVSNGIYNVAGRAVILHEGPDDFGQPTGNAGARIGCGVIVVTGE